MGAVQQIFLETFRRCPSPSPQGWCSVSKGMCGQWSKGYGKQQMGTPPPLLSHRVHPRRYIRTSVPLHLKRFWRVATRMTRALSEGVVLPGAGACEVACATSLELEALRCAIAVFSCVKNQGYSRDGHSQGLDFHRLRAACSSGYLMCFSVVRYAPAWKCL